MCRWYNILKNSLAEMSLDDPTKVFKPNWFVQKQTAPKGVKITKPLNSSPLKLVVGFLDILPMFCVLGIKKNGFGNLLMECNIGPDKEGYSALFPTISL